MEETKTKTISLSPEQVDEIRANCRKALSTLESLQRLFNNPDFKSVFLEDYVKEHAFRLVQLLAEPTFVMGDRKSENRDDLQERMIGIARFSEYLRFIQLKGQQAEKDLNQLDEAERIYCEQKEAVVLENYE